MNRLIKLLRSNSLFLKIISAVTVSIAFTSIAITILAVNISRNIFVDVFNQSTSQILTQVDSNMQNLHSNIVDMMTMVSDSWAFQGLLKNYDVMTPQSQSRTMYNIRQQIENSTLSNSFDGISIAIIGYNGQTYLSNSDQFDRPSAELWDDEMTHAAMENPQRIFYQFIPKGFTAFTKNSSTLAAVKALKDNQTDTVYGMIYVLIPQEKLRDFNGYAVNDYNDILIINEENLIISSSQTGEIGGQVGSKLADSVGVLENSESPYEYVTLDGQLVAVIIQELANFNCTIIQTIDVNLLTDELYNPNTIILISVAVTLVIGVFIFIIIRRTISPLMLLVKKMNDVTKGDFSNTIVVSGSYEIRALTNAYNYMLNGLNHYVNELLLVQQEKRTAEIHALQMQINPHFIYNTLSSFKWLVWQNEREKAIQMVDAFITLLEQTVNNNNETITIKEEINTLKCYAMIYHMRYGDNIKVDFYCAPEHEKYLIPKLVLQPFLENAFFHAFNGRSHGEIQVFISKRKNTLVCEVVDNGTGMVLKEDGDFPVQGSHRHMTGIGIKNVNERIKLLYGKEYGVHFSSEVGSGTAVTVTIPLMEERKDDENQDKGSNE